MQTSHTRRTYDYRIQEAICKSGDRELFPELNIPRSTIRSWIHRGAPEVITSEHAALPQLRSLCPLGIIVILLGALTGICGCTHSTKSSIVHGGEIHEDQIPYDEWSEASERGFAALEEIELESPWFKVYQVAPGVVAIHEPGHWEGVIAYLIEGSERALLVDSGLGLSTIKAVTDQLTNQSITVVNSHSHQDHVSNNHLYSEVWAFVTDFTRERVRGTSNSEALEFVPEDSFYLEPPAEFNRSTYSVKAWTVTHELADGEVIDLGDRKLEVIHVPGHTPDSIALIDRENRLLLTGDTFYFGEIYGQLEESNLRDYLRSMARLVVLESDIDWILPSHSPPSRDTTSLSRFHDALARILAGSPAAGYREMEPWGRISVYPNDGFWIYTRRVRVGNTRAVFGSSENTSYDKSPRNRAFAPSRGTSSVSRVQDAIDAGNCCLQREPPGCGSGDAKR